MTSPPQDPHADFLALRASWQLALDSDGYSKNTMTSYGRALDGFARWMAEHHAGVGPAGVTRDHIRAWIVFVRNGTSSGTARSWFAGLRHFFRWCVDEREIGRDPTEGVKTPAPNDPATPVLSPEQIKALLGTCSGSDFTSRRDAAVIYVMLDGGLRLAEVTGLTVDDVDLRDRVLFVYGKGSNRSGPRRRAVPLGVRAMRAVDAYLRARRRHPYAHMPNLWLGTRNRGPISAGAIDNLLDRRAREAGIVGVHPHALRHTWASQFRTAGGSEGDLMTLGGWRSRAMLDRYGKAAAVERAQESYRRLSLGDRL